MHRRFGSQSRKPWLDCIAESEPDPCAPMHGGSISENGRSQNQSRSIEIEYPPIG